MSDTAIVFDHRAAHKLLRFWLTFGLAIVSLAAVTQNVEPRLSYKHYDGQLGPAFSSDFDITTNEVKFSIRGIAVTLHDTKPYVTFVRE